VDVGAKAAIYRRIVDSAAAGMAVLVASSDAEELVHLCDRVIVLRAGMVSAELEGDRLTEDRLVVETLGATSDRRNMKLSREPVMVRVIRDDADLPPEDDSGPVGTTTMQAREVPEVGGRFAAWVRRAVGRLRRKG
jgi:ABC-type multidrug transport system ATPase subunit